MDLAKFSPNTVPGSFNLGALVAENHATHVLKATNLRRLCHVSLLCNQTVIADNGVVAHLQAPKFWLFYLGFGLVDRASQIQRPTSLEGVFLLLSHAVPEIP